MSIGYVTWWHMIEMELHNFFHPIVCCYTFNRLKVTNQRVRISTKESELGLRVYGGRVTSGARHKSVRALLPVSTEYTDEPTRIDICYCGLGCNSRLGVAYWSALYSICTWRYLIGGACITTGTPSPNCKYVVYRKTSDLIRCNIHCIRASYQQPPNANCKPLKWAFKLLANQVNLPGTCSR
jgi:hypothetical protein